MGSESCRYGVGDGSYQAVGGITQIIKLVDSFYDFMDTLPEAKKIRSLHRDDLTMSKKRLAYFLSGWLGGPNLYAENFGSINIPLSHKHLKIGADESEAWILCMTKAVAELPCEESFRQYLIKQLRVPAERIRVMCESNGA